MAQLVVRLVGEERFVVLDFLRDLAVFADLGDDGEQCGVFLVIVLPTIDVGDDGRVGDEGFEFLVFRFDSFQFF